MSVRDEETPLLVGTKERKPKEAFRQPQLIFAFLLVIATASLLFSVNLPLAKYLDHLFFAASDDNIAEISTPTFTFTMVKDGYRSMDYFSNQASDIYKYKILEGYVAIIEPHATMNLEITSMTDASMYFKYTICNANDYNECYDGVVESISGGGEASQSVNIPCQVKTSYDITVTAYTVDRGDAIFSQTNQGLCMYVRREIRTLTSSDLSAAMDAMHTLWIFGEEEGQKIYGENYHSADYLTQIHDFNSAWQDSDHIHEGLGFLPQHIKQTTIFETAVQAVDPSFALPYWDYSVEASSNNNIFNNAFFAEDTFGTVVSPNDDVYGWTYGNSSILAGAIPDGRWANISAVVSDKYKNLANPYGYMRGPWNTNPSPYVSRFAIESSSLPGCSSFYSLLKYDDMMDFLAQSPYESHASTHGSIGGVFGCDAFDPLLEENFIKDLDSQMSICANWGFYIKELYRANYVATWTNCSTSLMELEFGNDYTCGLTCNSEYDTIFAEKLSTVISAQYLPDDMSLEGWEAWKEFICEGDAYKVFTGDHLESASPYDPSFWVIHPTQERLLHAKYMAGGFVNDTWPTNPVTDFVCSKGVCFEADYGSKDSYGECCFGHYQFDQLMDFTSGNRTGGFGDTNDYVMKATDPRSEGYAMTYIYEGFSWPHCINSGFDFDVLVEEMYSRNWDDVADNSIVVPYEPTSGPTYSPLYNGSSFDNVTTDDDYWNSSLYNVTGGNESYFYYFVNITGNETVIDVEDVDVNVVDATSSAVPSIAPTPTSTYPPESPPTDFPLLDDPSAAPLESPSSFPLPESMPSLTPTIGVAINPTIAPTIAAPTSSEPTLIPSTVPTPQLTNWPTTAPSTAEVVVEDVDTPSPSVESASAPTQYPMVVDSSPTEPPKPWLIQDVTITSHPTMPSGLTPLPTMPNGPSSFTRAPTEGGMESEPTAKPTHNPTASPLADEDEDVDEDDTAKPTHNPTSSPVADVVVSSSEPTVQGHPTERPTYTIGDNPPPPSITNDVFSNQAPSGSASGSASGPSDVSSSNDESESAATDVHPTTSKVSVSKGPWLTRYQSGSPIEDYAVRR